MHSDHACQKAISLFQSFKEARESGEVILSDPLYLSYYAE